MRDRRRRIQGKGKGEEWRREKGVAKRGGRRKKEGGRISRKKERGKV